jgi:CxxC-x17-CxxC domain-containing protein
MEQHRDDHIVCAECGASFLFSAGEAAVFAERGLASPRRCKDCRRARKERGDGGARRAHGEAPPRRQAAPHNGHDGNFARPSGRGPREPQFAMGSRARHGAAPYGAPARYTGDVNEYRSPMQDNSYTAPWQNGGANQAPRRPHPGGHRSSPHPRAGRWNDDGNYRAPSTQAEARGGRQGDAAGAPPPAARRRPPAEKFSITCDSCGAQAEVPFKPAEGREVFCQACYRARKPA